MLSYVVKAFQIGGRIGQSQFLLQVSGTPQGSVLSAFLCCALLGALERKYIFPLLKSQAETSNKRQKISQAASAFAPKSYSRSNSTPASSSSESSFEDHVLIRQIDDYLMLSLSAEKAHSFLNRLHLGFPDYGVELNVLKTKVNFPVVSNVLGFSVFFF